MIALSILNLGNLSNIYGSELGSLSLDADEKFDGVKDAATDISRTVSRRDIATQMSPEGSIFSSPERKPSFSPSSPTVLPIVELQSVNSSKLEIRDVQVDERVTMTRWSKKHRGRIPGKGSENVDGWKKKAVEAHSSAWEVSETAKSISKYVHLTVVLFMSPVFCYDRKNIMQDSFEVTGAFGILSIRMLKIRNSKIPP